MNAKDAVVQLRHLAGQRLVMMSKRSELIEVQDCRDVLELEPEQRIEESGNVILWNGEVDREGRLSGAVFWARDLARIQRMDIYTVLYPMDGTDEVWILSVGAIGGLRSWVTVLLRSPEPGCEAVSRL